MRSLFALIASHMRREDPLYYRVLGYAFAAVGVAVLAFVLGFIGRMAEQDWLFLFALFLMGLAIVSVILCMLVMTVLAVHSFARRGWRLIRRIHDR